MARKFRKKQIRKVFGYITQRSHPLCRPTFTHETRPDHVLNPLNTNSSYSIIASRGARTLPRVFDDSSLHATHTKVLYHYSLSQSL
jgi:hypothetical protein